MDLIESSESKQRKIAEIDEEIAMVRGSAVSEDAKEQLINEILAYKEKLQQNHTIIHGGSFVR